MTPFEQQRWICRQAIEHGWKGKEPSVLGTHDSNLVMAEVEEFMRGLPESCRNLIWDQYSRDNVAANPGNESCKKCHHPMWEHDVEHRLTALGEEENYYCPPCPDLERPARGADDAATQSASESTGILERWAVQFVDFDTPICHQASDGYWTPWHIAQQEIDRLRSFTVLEVLRVRILESSDSAVAELDQLMDELRRRHVGHRSAHGLYLGQESKSVAT